MKRISFLFFLIFPVYAQDFDASVEYTAQDQAYWIVTVDGEQVSQHTTEREAYESATNQWFITDGAQVQVVHNAVIDVTGNTTVTGIEPEIIEVPVEVIVEVPVIEYVEVEKIVEKIVEVEVEKIVYVEVGSDPIEIPGASDWVPVPDFGAVRQFMVLNDTWAVASNNLWLYAFLIDTDSVPGVVINRPSGWYRNAPALSETTPITDEQVVELITQVVSNVGL